jgi:hypothetical protein
MHAHSGRHGSASIAWSLRSVPLSLSLAGALVLAACGSVSGGSNGADGGPGDAGTDAERIAGSYEVDSIEGDLLVLPRESTWFRFKADNTYEIFTENSLGFRTVYEGVFLATDSQLLLSLQQGPVLLYNYDLDGDTVSISRPGGVATGIRNPAMPEAVDWMPPITIQERAVLGPPSSTLQPTDLAFDGTYLWYGNAYARDREQLVRYNFADKEEVSALDTNVWAWGLAWDGVNLWASSNGYDSIHQINMTTGSSSFSSAEMGSWIPGIAADGDHLWAVSSNERTLYKYTPATNTVDSSTKLGDSWGLAGMTAVGGSLYLILGNTVQKIDPSSIMATRTYSLKGLQQLTGITHDGTDFYLMGVEGEDVVILRVSLP